MSESSVAVTEGEGVLVDLLVPCLHVIGEGALKGNRTKMARELCCVYHNITYPCNLLLKDRRNNHDQQSSEKNRNTKNRQKTAEWQHS